MSGVQIRQRSRSRAAEAEVMCRPRSYEAEAGKCPYRILKEEGVAHVVIRDIILHAQLMHAVDGTCAVVRVVYGAVAQIGLINRSRHLEYTEWGAGV